MLAVVSSAIGWTGQLIQRPVSRSRSHAANGCWKTPWRSRCALIGIHWVKTQQQGSSTSCCVLVALLSASEVSQGQTGAGWSIKTGAHPGLNVFCQTLQMHCSGTPRSSTGREA